MVDLYPMCAFGEGAWPRRSTRRSTRSCRSPHVDHLHPDWAIALAASANGRAKLDEFNARFGRRIVWVPWQRPGFELALMLRRAVADTPGCDGIVLGGHGLFTWGETQRECYLSSITHHRPDGPVRRRTRRRARPGPAFGGVSMPVPPSFDGSAARDRDSAALRGAVSYEPADRSRTGTAPTMR